MQDHSNTEELVSKLATLEQRLGATERRLQRHRLMLVGTVVAGFGLLLAAAGTERILDTVKTRRLELVNDAGKVVMLASAQPSGGQIDLWGSNGANLFRATTNDEGGDLVIWNTAGKSVFSAWASESGGTMAMGDRNGNTYMRTAALGEGGSFQMLDPQQNVVIDQRCTDSGAKVELGTRDGRTGLTLATSSIGGQLRLNQPMNAMSLNADPSSISLSDEDSTTFSVMTDQSGSMLTMSSAEGADRFTARTGADGARLRVDGGAEGMLSLGEGEDSLLTAMDARGNRRFDLHIDEQFTRMQLNDQMGQPSVVSTAHEDMSRLELFDGNSPMTVLTGRHPDSSSGALELFNSRGYPVLAAGSTSRGSGRLLVGSEVGMPMMICESDEDNGCSLNLYRDQYRHVAIASSRTGGLLNIQDAQGRTVLLLGSATDREGGAFVLRDARGATVMQAGVDNRGGGEVTVYDPDGTRKTVLSPPSGRTLEDTTSP